MENISVFTSQALRMSGILQGLTLSFAQFSSAVFVFCVLSCIAFWDTHFMEETRKMMYFEHVTRPRIKQSQSP